MPTHKSLFSFKLALSRSPTPQVSIHISHLYILQSIMLYSIIEKTYKNMLVIKEANKYSHILLNKYLQYF